MQKLYRAIGEQTDSSITGLPARLLVSQSVFLAASALVQDLAEVANNLALLTKALTLPQKDGEKELQNADRKQDEKKEAETKGGRSADVFAEKNEKKAEELAERNEEKKVASEDNGGKEGVKDIMECEINDTSIETLIQQDQCQLLNAAGPQKKESFQQDADNEENTTDDTKEECELKKQEPEAALAKSAKDQAEDEPAAEKVAESAKDHSALQAGIEAAKGEPTKDSTEPADSATTHYANEEGKPDQTGPNLGLGDLATNIASDGVVQDAAVQGQDTEQDCMNANSSDGGGGGGGSGAGGGERFHKLACPRQLLRLSFGKKKGEPQLMSQSHSDMTPASNPHQNEVPSPAPASLAAPLQPSFIKKKDHSTLVSQNQHHAIKGGKDIGDAVVTTSSIANTLTDLLAHEPVVQGKEEENEEESPISSSAEQNFLLHVGVSSEKESRGGGGGGGGGVEKEKQGLVSDTLRNSNASLPADPNPAPKTSRTLQPALTSPKLVDAQAASSAAAQPIPDASPAESTLSHLLVGSAVKIHGLTRAAVYNSLMGSITQMLPDKRALVKLPLEGGAKEISVSLDNLEARKLHTSQEFCSGVPRHSAGEDVRLAMLSQRVDVSVMMGGGDEEEGESQAGTGAQQDAPAQTTCNISVDEIPDSEEEGTAYQMDGNGDDKTAHVALKAPSSSTSAASPLTSAAEAAKSTTLAGTSRSSLSITIMYPS